MEILADIRDYFNNRIRSPFLISFLIAWGLWNWFFLYYFFNFPEKWDMVTRSNFIDTYIRGHRWTNIFWWPLLSSCVATIVYIICSALFLAAFTYYKVTIKAFIYEKMSKGSNVPKILYKYADKKLRDLESENDRLTQVNATISEEKSQTTNKYRELLGTTATDIQEKEKLEKTVKELNRKIKNLERQEEESEIEFLRIFANSKRWLIVPKGHNDLMLEVRFEMNFNVVNLKTNEIAFEVVDVSLSKDAFLFSFTLISTRNRDEKHIFNVSRIDNVFHGFYRRGNIHALVYMTQD